MDSNSFFMRRAFAKPKAGELVQTAAINGGFLHTTNDGWATFTARTNVGSRNWFQVAISPTNPLVQTAVTYGYIYTTADGWATFTERVNVGAKNWFLVAIGT